MKPFSNVLLILPYFVVCGRLEAPVAPDPQPGTRSRPFSLAAGWSVPHAITLCSTDQIRNCIIWSRTEKGMTHFRILWHSFPGSLSPWIPSITPQTCSRAKGQRSKAGEGLGTGSCDVRSSAHDHCKKDFAVGDQSVPGHDIPAEKVWSLLKPQLICFDFARRLL